MRREGLLNKKSYGTIPDAPADSAVDVLDDQLAQSKRRVARLTLGTGVVFVGLAALAIIGPGAKGAASQRPMHVGG